MKNRVLQQPRLIADITAPLAISHRSSINRNSIHSTSKTLTVGNARRNEPDEIAHGVHLADVLVLEDQVELILKLYEHFDESEGIGDNVGNFHVVVQYPQVTTELKEMSKQFDVLSEFGYYLFKDILPFLNTVIHGLSQALDKPLEDDYWARAKEARRESYRADEGEITYILDQMPHYADGESMRASSEDALEVVPMHGSETRPAYNLGEASTSSIFD